MSRIIERPEGFYCIVNGVEHGAWRSKGEAKAGLETELRRAEARKSPAPLYTYRLCRGGEPSGALEAPSSVTAMRLLKCTSIENLQIFKNGVWQWVC
jgi:hypothetical protein